MPSNLSLKSKISEIFDSNAELLLNEWEEGFLGSIMNDLDDDDFEPSRKQISTINDIYERVM